MTKEELTIKVGGFVKKYEGQTLGYPEGSYVGQCLSLVKVYIKEVFGINPPPSGSNSAYGYWANFPAPLGEVFEKVPIYYHKNGPLFTGCIPIWDNNAGNGSGHIDIFLEGNDKSFTGFDANWGGTKAHKQSHDYTNIVGWLAPKVTVPDIIPPAIKVILETERTRMASLQTNYDALALQFDKQKGQLLELEQTNGTLQAKIVAAIESKYKSALGRFFGKLAVNFG